MEINVLTMMIYFCTHEIKQNLFTFINKKKGNLVT